MAQPSPFTPAFFDFFRELSENNEKDWFEANRDRYEQDVLAPSKVFVLAFRPHLKEISPHFQAEAKVRGGSLFRIYTNRRFNRDRPPYKDHAGIQFRHAAGTDVHTPGFYLHLTPDDTVNPRGGDQRGCFVGMGIWRPDAAALLAIREAIVEDPDAWMESTRNDAFTEHLELGGESLKLGPNGFDRQHPLIDDIKRKDFIASAPLTEEDVVTDGFVERFAAHCREGSSLVRWLCQALDVPF
ncbi:MAG: TIGR02453 family protein [Longimicrobiales bacterium]|nr:TIGR02453 family protein [Longimicrobiales bacterium]